MVAGEGNRRYGLRFPGLSTMESDAQLRRCANPPGPGRVTVKHWSHLGLTYTPCRLDLENDKTNRLYREHSMPLAQCCSRQRHQRINSKD